TVFRCLPVVPNFETLVALGVRWRTRGPPGIRADLGVNWLHAAVGQNHDYGARVGSLGPVEVAVLKLERAPDLELGIRTYHAGDGALTRCRIGHVDVRIRVA